MKDLGKKMAKGLYFLAAAVVILFVLAAASFNVTKAPAILKATDILFRASIILITVVFIHKLITY